MASNGSKPPSVHRKGVQTFIYPRPRTRAVLERAAKKAKVRLSNWIMMAALEKVARGGDLDLPLIRGVIPAEDFAELQRQRGMSIDASDLPSARLSRSRRKQK